MEHGETRERTAGMKNETDHHRSNRSCPVDRLRLRDGGPSISGMKTYTIKDLKWEREGSNFVAHSIGGTFCIRGGGSNWTCVVHRFIGITSHVCVGHLEACKREANEWHRKAVASHMKEIK